MSLLYPIPKKQPGMLVLGGKFALKNKQMSRFLQLNETEQTKFKNSVVLISSKL